MKKLKTTAITPARYQALYCDQYTKVREQMTALIIQFERILFKRIKECSRCSLPFLDWPESENTFCSFTCQRLDSEGIKLDPALLSRLHDQGLLIGPERKR